MADQAEFTPADVEDARKMDRGEAIQYHYDNDTRFFALWLDKALNYSSARWFDPLSGAQLATDLATAQREKVQYHLDAAKVERGSRLMDIGCGWGAVLNEAVTGRGATYALGLTLSEDQKAHIDAKAWPGVEVRLEDAFKFKADEPFDAAISIGAFEHFAKPNMPTDEKIAVYAEFFGRMAEHLKQGARFSLQTIVWEDVSFEWSNETLPETIFPQSSIPYIEEVIAGAAQTFRLQYLENDPKHYQLTLEAWIANFKAQRETIENQWGEEKYRFFLDYLRYSRLAFTRRKNSLSRFVFLRR